MHYLVMIQPKEPSDNGPLRPRRKLAYLRGVPDIRDSQFTDSDRRDVIEDAIEAEDPDIDIDRGLDSIEQVQVIPNARVGEQERQLQKAAYIGELSLPDDLVKEHNQRLDHKPTKRRGS